MHRSGIVHHDLSTSNVLWRREPTSPVGVDFCVIDFGHSWECADTDTEARRTAGQGGDPVVRANGIDMRSACMDLVTIFVGRRVERGHPQYILVKPSRWTALWDMLFDLYVRIQQKVPNADYRGDFEWSVVNALRVRVSDAASLVDPWPTDPAGEVVGNTHPDELYRALCRSLVATRSRRVIEFYTYFFDEYTIYYIGTCAAKEPATAHRILGLTDRPASDDAAPQGCA